MDLAATGDKGVAVATELQPDGTIKVLRVQPFLAPALDAALIPNRIGELLRQKVMEMYTKPFPAFSRISATSFGPGSRTHTTPMAHPACPWPYGTVIRPIGESLHNYAPEMRQMIVGPQPADPEVIISIYLNGESNWIGGMVYSHVAEDITKRWEEVPD